MTKPETEAAAVSPSVTKYCHTARASADYRLYCGTGKSAAQRSGCTECGNQGDELTRPVTDAPALTTLSCLINS